MGSDAAEFVNKVKDQVRNRQKRMSNVADSGEEHSITWGMFKAATMNAATFMGKNSWRQLSLIGDETVISLQRAKVYVFSDSVLCLGKIHQHPESNETWKKRIGWIITEKNYRDFDGINGEPTEFEWNIFPGFTTLQLCGKVTDLLSRLGETPETFTGRILFMSMFNDISCDSKGNEEEYVANVKVVSILAKEVLVLVNGHLLDQILKRSGILLRIVHKVPGIISRTRCRWNSQKAGVQFSVQQLQCPGVISKAKDTENCRYILLRIIQQLRLFRIIVSANQLSLNGAVANMCEQFESHQDRSGQSDVLMGTINCSQ